MDAERFWSPALASIFFVLVVLSIITANWPATLASVGAVCGWLTAWNLAKSRDEARRGPHA